MEFGGGFFRSVFGSFSLPRFFFCGLQVIHNIPMLILNWWHTHSNLKSPLFVFSVSAIFWIRQGSRHISVWQPRSAHPSLFTAQVTPSFPTLVSRFLAVALQGAFALALLPWEAAFLRSCILKTSWLSFSRNAGWALCEVLGSRWTSLSLVQIWLRHALEFRVADEKSDVVIVFVPSLLIGPFPSSCPCWTR